MVGPGHVLTCAHVVLDALDRDREQKEPPEQPVRLRLPLRTGATETYCALVVHEAWRALDDSPKFGIASDIALLQLKDEKTFPDTIRQAPLRDGGEKVGRSVWMKGFPATGKDDTVGGILLGLNQEGRIQIDPKVEFRVVEPGFSGAPIWDEAADNVLGMLVSRRAKSGTQIAYGIPAAVLAAETGLLLGSTEPDPGDLIDPLPEHFRKKKQEEVGALESGFQDFLERHNVPEDVRAFSKKAVSELDALRIQSSKSGLDDLRIQSAKDSIRQARQSQLEGQLLDALMVYGHLSLMWGQAELLEGKINEATESFLSISALLTPFSPLEAARHLKDGGRACFNHGQSFGGAALGNSVRIYRRAIRHITKREHPYEWANIKNYIGESYRLMGKRNVENRYQFWLDAAIREYSSSLKTFEVEARYHDAALVRANIALSFFQKGRLDDKQAGLQNLQVACQELEATLAELPPVKEDLLTARICHYLGNCYGEIGIRSSGGEKVDWIQWAVEKYELALSNSEFSEVSERRANTLNNKGNALIQLCAEVRDARTFERLQDARKVCEDALRIRSKSRFPLEFAQTSTNLAHIFLILSRVAPDKERDYLILAERKCKAAAKLRSPIQVPLDWIETRLLLGEIYEGMDKMAIRIESGEQEDPVLVYSDVLSVSESVGVPYYIEWAQRKLEEAINAKSVGS